MYVQSRDKENTNVKAQKIKEKKEKRKTMKSHENKQKLPV